MYYIDEILYTLNLHAKNKIVDFVQSVRQIHGYLKRHNIYRLCKRTFLGYIAANIVHFNKFFDKNIPLVDKDGIDIYKAKSMKEILEFLSKPIPFCGYCKVNGRTFGHKWGISKKIFQNGFRYIQ